MQNFIVCVCLEIKSFTGKLVDAVWYFNKTNSQHIAGRWVIEPEIDNSCHLHILIRATLDASTPEATERIDHRRIRCGIVLFCGLLLFQQVLLDKHFDIITDNHVRFLGRLR
jgi:hypothetical protein